MRTRPTTLLPKALLGVLVSTYFGMPVWAAADVNSFALMQNGKKVGNASYTIGKAKDGSVKVHSKYEYKVDPAALMSAMNGGAPAEASASSGGGGGRRGGGGQAPGVPLFGQYIFEYKVDPSGDFLSGFTEDMTNTKMTSYQPGKPREMLTISQAQGNSIGLAQPIHLPRGDYAIIPSFDASAVQMLLTKALEHPAQDKTYLAVIQAPGGAGNSPAYIVVLPAGEAKGTLDGKPVTVKHYRLNLNKGHAELFADENGKLMEADMNMLATDMVRAGFKLDE